MAPLPTAGGALAGQGSFGAAVVTAQRISLPVHSQAGIAVQAGGNPATRRTSEGWRIAATVDEEQGLALFAQVLFDRLQTGGRETRRDFLVAQIE